MWQRNHSLSGRVTTPGIPLPRPRRCRLRANREGCLRYTYAPHRTLGNWVCNIDRLLWSESEELERPPGRLPLKGRFIGTAAMPRARQFATLSPRSCQWCLIPGKLATGGAVTFPLPVSVSPGQGLWERGSCSSAAGLNHSLTLVHILSTTAQTPTPLACYSP